jgi:hypothetical protein
MLSDQQLIDLSMELDEYLYKTAEKYQVGGLSLSAIVLARLIRLNDEIESRKDFDKIMASAMNVTPISQQELH